MRGFEISFDYEGDELRVSVDVRKLSLSYVGHPNRSDH